MKKIRFILYTISLSVLLAVLIDGCKEESNPATPPDETPEHPPATAVTFVITDNVTNVTDTCLVRDTTLVKGGLPLVGSLDLVAGHTYSGSFRLYDESQTPTAVVTGDIISEKDAHLFILTPSDTNRVKITGLDTDSKGLAFGLNFTITVTSGTATTGVIHVILQHHDDGVKFNSNGSFHDPYDLDVDADFPFTITQ